MTLKPSKPIPPSDADLARASQRGDKKAFVEIVARYQALVCGVALGILHDFAASEDVAQEAFLTAWRKIQDLRQPAQLKPWLIQIARHAALGQLRRRKGSEELHDDLPDQAPLPDESAASCEEAILVETALAKLPENYRVPLVLFYRQDQSVADALKRLQEAPSREVAAESFAWLLP